MNRSEQQRSAPAVRIAAQPAPVGLIRQARLGRPTSPVWRSVAVNPFIFAALGLLVFLGTIQVASWAGLWTTTGRVTGTGEQVVVTGKDPAEIRGWMSIDQVSAGYGLTRAEFDAQFNVPAGTSGETQLKQLEQLAPGFSTEKVREWLASRRR